MIEFGELFGYYVVFIDKTYAVLLALGLAVLAVAVPYLANRPQPVPNWNAWGAVESVRRHRKGKR